MKAKVKLDLGSIKGWLMEHGEKVAFAIVALVFVGFVYSAARREVLEESKQPERLQAVANDVRARVQKSQFDAKREGFQIVDYEKRAKRDPVAAAQYALAAPFSNPLLDEKIKRDDPKLFGAEELKVAAGYGPFALKGDGTAPPAGAPPAAPKPVPKAAPKPAGGGGFGGLGRGAAQMGGNIPVPGRPAAGGGGGVAQGGRGFKPSPSSKLQPRAWAVVTGLVPIEKQRKEYARVFERAMNEDRERDTPHYFAVKVQRTEVSDADPTKTDWKPVEDPAAFEEQWENKINEIIAPAYIDPNLTADLGPLVGTDWGEAVAHPKIPLASARSSEAEVPLAPNENKPPEPEAAKPADAEGLVGHKTRTVAPPPAPAPAPSGPASATPPIAYRLLRIFDYSVEPNKRYRYRIQLALNNPNYKVADRYLKNPGAPRGELRFTDEWVETPVVAIPSGIGVLAGGLPSGLKPKNSADPSKAKLLLRAIEKESGVEATVVKELERGAVANSKEKELKAHDPRTGNAIDLSDVSFATDTLLLDIYGGRKLSNKRDSSLASPIEVLLLDKGGHLSVRSELDDHQQFEMLKPPEDAGPASTDSKKLPSKLEDFKPKRTRNR